MSVKKRGISAILILMLILSLSAAVSYTHLDVYKRQGQNEAYKIKKSKRKYDGRNVTADADHIVSDIKPVSYTHLFCV